MVIWYFLVKLKSQKTQYAILVATHLASNAGIELAFWTVPILSTRITHFISGKRYFYDYMPDTFRFILPIVSTVSTQIVAKFTTRNIKVQRLIDISRSLNGQESID